MTFNTHKRHSLLARSEIRELFIDYCKKASKYHIAVGRFVIMPDHVHLFVLMPREGLTLSEWVKGLKTILGKELLTLGYEKPHWQEGFFDHVLRSSESYSEKWNYVRENPVRAGLCTSSEEWPYQGEIVPIRF